MLTLLLYLTLATTPAHDQCGMVYVCNPETGQCQFIYVPC